MPEKPKCYTELTLSEPLSFQILNHRFKKKEDKHICKDCGLVLKGFNPPGPIAPYIKEPI